jgi:hypothetical protein
MFLFKSKDGGQESTVTGYWLVELKGLFSALLLRFDGQSREAFHTHAFNAISWVLQGELNETFLDGTKRRHRPSFRPVLTPRNVFHKVDSVAPRTWVLSFRGPWVSRWWEFLPPLNKFAELTHGRRILQLTKEAPASA